MYITQYEYVAERLVKGCLPQRLYGSRNTLVTWTGVSSQDLVSQALLTC